MSNRTEVGMVYTRGDRVFLALDDDVLLNGRGGSPRRVSRRASDRVSRGISVDDLCQRWAVTVEQLDAWAREHLRRPTPKRTRGRGARRRNQIDWRGLRLHRLRLG